MPLPTKYLSGADETSRRQQKEATFMDFDPPAASTSYEDDNRRMEQHHQVDHIHRPYAPAWRDEACSAATQQPSMIDMNRDRACLLQRSPKEFHPYHQNNFRDVCGPSNTLRPQNLDQNDAFSHWRAVENCIDGRPLEAERPRSAYRPEAFEQEHKVRSYEEQHQVPQLQMASHLASGTSRDDGQKGAQHHDATIFAVENEPPSKIRAATGNRSPRTPPPSKQGRLYQSQTTTTVVNGIVTTVTKTPVGPYSDSSSMDSKVKHFKAVFHPN